MKSSIEKISQLHPDLIAQFLATGSCSAIPVPEQLFLQQLQWSMEIYETDHNISSCARKLRDRIAAEQHVQIELRTCQARVYQAINYFCVDNNVAIKVWENVYADRYEDLAAKATEAEDYRTAAHCHESALECRRRASEINENASGLGITMLFTPEVTPELLGFQSKSLKQIAAKHNQGYYSNLIDQLPVDSDEKKRLKKDAGI